jgi:hypothetical protein
MFFFLLTVIFSVIAVLNELTAWRWGTLFGPAWVRRRRVETYIWASFAASALTGAVLFDLIVPSL